MSWSKFQSLDIYSGSIILHHVCNEYLKTFFGLTSVFDMDI